MHLVEKGSLSLDNTVAQFIADFPDGARVTIRDLLEGRPDPETAYRALARIVAQRSGVSFGEALNGLLFASYWMDGAGIDSDDLEPGQRYALGYVGDGAAGLKRADAPRWSELAGDASLYATTRDELRFLNVLFGDGLLAPETRARMFSDAKPGFGYGWERRDDPKLGGRVFSRTGQAGGFSAFVLHAPARDVTVLLLGNVESPALPSLGAEIAALTLSGP
jgi:CubicO group peptidase (beta-lactamase class C family)